MGNIFFSSAFTALPPTRTCTAQRGHWGRPNTAVIAEGGSYRLTSSAASPAMMRSSTFTLHNYGLIPGSVRRGPNSSVPCKHSPEDLNGVHASTSSVLCTRLCIVLPDSLGLPLTNTWRLQNHSSLFLQSPRNVKSQLVLDRSLIKRDTRKRGLCCLGLSSNGIC